MEAEEEKSNLESFLEWAAELAISDSPISNQSQLSKKPSSCLGRTLCVSHFADAGGRGLAAARDVKKGELILRVPISALMTRECLLNENHSLSVAVKKYPSLSSTQIFVVALLNEVNKGKNSSWYPYLLQLPRSYDTLAGFGRFEMQALQVEDAIWTAARVREKAELEWKEASVLMVELNLRPQLRTFKAWLWSSATISSRTMHIPWDVAGCLCPVGDFFNYVAPGEDQSSSDDSSSNETTVSLDATSSGSWDSAEKPDFQHDSAICHRLTDAGYEEDVAAYCFYSRRNYQKGEQVLLSYGTYTNLELLEHYGFLLNSNPNDKGFIPVESEVIALCSWPKDLSYIHKDGQPSYVLLSTVRLWTAPASQRKALARVAYSGSQLPVESEIKALRWIATKCHATLKNFQTSVEQDGLLLDIMNKMQESFTSMETEKMISTFRDEFCALMKSHNFMSTENASNFCKPKSFRSIYRWKLAVHWRFMYKKILSDCITHCRIVIDKLLRQTDFETENKSVIFC